MLLLAAASHGTLCNIVNSTGTGAPPMEGDVHRKLVEDGQRWGRHVSEVWRVMFIW